MSKTAGYVVLYEGADLMWMEDRKFNKAAAGVLFRGGRVATLFPTRARAKAAIARSMAYAKAKGWGWSSDYRIQRVESAPSGRMRAE